MLRSSGVRRHRHTPSARLFAGVVRASSIFPILSAILLLLGGVCVAASRFYKSKRNIILGAGILFVAAGIVSYSAVFLFPQITLFLLPYSVPVPS